MKKFSDKALELISEENGRLSHTKLWANIGNFIVTVAFIYHVYKAEVLDPELLGIYIAAVALQRTASKFTSKKRYEKSRYNTHDTNFKNNKESLNL